MEIYLDIDPPRATAQQKGEMVGADGRIHHYTKSRVRAAGNLMGTYLMRYAPERPLSGPIYLHVIYVFTSKSGRKHHGEWKTTRPDTDNLLKLLKDVMTQCGFWEVRRSRMNAPRRSGTAGKAVMPGEESILSAGAWKKVRTVSFAENLRRIRKAKGVTVSRLAEAIGTGEGAVYNWEAGRYAPGMWSIVKLCDALQCSADELLFGGSDP